ncbi:MAG: DUF4388 domain-containing protein [Planctomycetes bacterium]|nr:DUF4388 domain-containing protein [Planctomycetota bacterium]
MASTSQIRADVPSGEVKDRVLRLIDALVYEDRPRAEEGFANLLERAGELWRRKQAMEGTKSETRDLIGEVLFSRLRRSFRTFHEQDDAEEEIRSAEWVLDSLFAGGAMNAFATALDRAMLEASRPQDFSFAGRADFISIEEVLQLLAAGGYDGMLGIEKDDNRIDLYIGSGQVRFFDPHKLLRRVLPSPDGMSYREIPQELIDTAEAAKAKDGTPLLITLADEGFLKRDEVVELLPVLGLEVFYEFLAQQGACTFFYRKVRTTPEFVANFGRAMPITPILLEGSKRADDWAAMCQVFPDPDRPLRAVPDLFARIAGMDLGVTDIKLLAMINGENTPNHLARAMGLPLFDIYRRIVRYARDGVLEADLGGASMEIMERAFATLDANEEELARRIALEGALGEPVGEGEDEGESFLDMLARADLNRA